MARVIVRDSASEFPGASDALGARLFEGDQALALDTRRFYYWDGSMWVLQTLLASQVLIQALGLATRDDLQDMQDLTRSAGHLDGGEVTDAGGETIDVTAGIGLIRGLSDDVSTLYTFDWAAAAGIAIPTDSVRYVAVEYNAGSPQVALYTSESYDYRTSFPLAIIINEGGTLYISETPHSSGRAPGRLIRRNYEVDGRSRAHQLGGLILSESGTLRVGVTAGVTWWRGVREEFPSFDSNVADTFDRYYRDGGGGWTIEAAQVAIPDGLYDDNSGVLQSIGTNDYAVYWLYLGLAGGIVMIYGRASHGSLTSAQMAEPPGDLPLRLQVGAMLLGRYIVQRTNPGPTYTVVEVDSAFTELFTVAPVTDHGALAGLADDDHPQYLLRSEYNPRRWAWMFGG